MTAGKTANKMRPRLMNLPAQKTRGLSSFIFRGAMEKFLTIKSLFRTGADGVLAPELRRRIIYLLRRHRRPNKHHSIINTVRVGMEDKEESLIDKYRLPDGGGCDEDTESWRRMLDLESSIKSESDWYSTRTFQVFLDALDINQPSNNNLNRSKNVSRESLAKAGVPNEVKTNKTVKDNPTTIAADNNKERSETTTRSNSRGNNCMETILSAEALKILSELPDLSQMSATRSFVFPINNRNTHIDSSKK